MIHLKKIAFGIVLLSIGTIAGWRLWGVAAPPPAAADQDARKSEIARGAAAWLKSRARAATPVQSVASLAPASAISAALPELSAVGLSETDGRAALSHAAEMMYHRFVSRDFQGYTRWRETMGYQFFPVQRLRQEPVMLDTVERVIGRKIHPDEADSRELWRLYWLNGVADSKRVTAIDQTSEGVLVLPARSQGLALRKSVPSRRGVPSRVIGTEPGTAGSRVEHWRGLRYGVGWPMWFPPDDVETRLEAAGVPVVEVAWVLVMETGEIQPFVLNLAMDPQTRRWWIMQWYIPHAENGVHINAGGL